MLEIKRLVEINKEIKTLVWMNDASIVTHIQTNSYSVVFTALFENRKRVGTLLLDAPAQSSAPPVSRRHWRSTASTRSAS